MLARNASIRNIRALDDRQQNRVAVTAVDRDRVPPDAFGGEPEFLVERDCGMVVGVDFKFDSHKAALARKAERRLN